jgi:hypothetical protein
MGLKPDRIIGLESTELAQSNALVRPSKMPVENMQRLIADMQDGEIAYTVDWALQIHSNGDVYIRGDYPANERGGTSSMRIQRQGEFIIVDRATIGRNYSAHDVSHAIRFWLAMPVILR